jgi:N-methylhydantoinase A
MDDHTAAVGIAEVVDENMTNAARVHAVENGKDLAGFAMVAFGGGAPLHASRLMDKLGLDELFVPPGAGVGSAIGFLRAPFAYEAVRSFYTRTDEFDYAAVNDVLADLTTEAEAFVRQGTAEPLLIERQVSMRYKGQGWEIPVKLGEPTRLAQHPALTHQGDMPGGTERSGEYLFDEFAAEGLAATFTKAYEEFFGRAIDDLAIEAVSWSVRVASVQERPPMIELVPASRMVEARTTRPMYDPVEQKDLDSGVFERTSLSLGDAVVGPAVIVEEQTTTVLGSHHQAVIQSDGTLLVTRARLIGISL